MKKILKKIALLLLPIFSLLLLDDIYCNYQLEKNGCYAIDPGTHILVLGHSHPQCAVNDTLIPQTISMAQSSDSYFYVYYKYKKLVEANPQINTIILGYTNNVFFENMDDWIYKETYMGYKFPKYSQVIGPADKFFLFRKNPATFLKSSLDAMKVKNKLAFFNRNKVYNSLTWGGYQYSAKSEVARILSEKVIDSAALLQTKAAYYNIVYLKKIIEHAQARHIKVILLRTPLHQAYKRAYENDLVSFVNACHGKVEFWDYSQFALPDADFIDLSHLNYKGADKFSRLLRNDLQKAGYLAN
jgi:hypothetical protein